MALSLVQHIKARTRSVQIDNHTSFDVAGLGLVDSASPNSRTSHRLSSLSMADENREPLTSTTAALPPATLRRYRSMLEVEDPPKLSPWKPMSFDELYAEPLQSAMDDDNSLEAAAQQKPQDRMDPPDIAMCRIQDSTSQATPGRPHCFSACLRCKLT